MHRRGSIRWNNKVALVSCEVNCFTGLDGVLMLIFKISSPIDTGGDAGFHSLSGRDWNSHYAGILRQEQEASRRAAAARAAAAEQGSTRARTSGTEGQRGERNAGSDEVEDWVQVWPMESPPPERQWFEPRRRWQD